MFAFFCVAGGAGAQAPPFPSNLVLFEVRKFRILPPLPLYSGGEGRGGLMKYIGDTAISAHPSSGEFVAPVPSPLYSGERGRGEGEEHPSPKLRVFARTLSPLTPDPSPPEYRGRGELPAQRKRDETTL